MRYGIKHFSATGWGLESTDMANDAPILFSGFLDSFRVVPWMVCIEAKADIVLAPPDGEL